MAKPTETDKGEASRSEASNTVSRAEAEEAVAVAVDHDERGASRPRRNKAVAADAAAAGATEDDSFLKVGNRVFRTLKSKLAGRTLDILPDLPDIRDRMYLPHLTALPSGIYPNVSFSVRDQGKEASCTGFALAHVIDYLVHRDDREEEPFRASSRMLYEMAKINDEWAGTAYEGSSIRGGLRGFYRNGVCTEASAPAKDKKAWALTYEMAKEARDVRLGAYLRLNPDLSDYHAALADVRVIYASAQIHSNWETPDDKGRIAPGGDPSGGHAFAIVGYDDTGFWVLNSWGPGWGKNGLAHWRYEDWAATIMDAWVLQLGVKAPNAFSAVAGVTPSSASGLFGPAEPNRTDIVGHFVNVDDGRLIMTGRYASPKAEEMKETVTRLTMETSNSDMGFEHLVIYAHGGLNSLADEARRIATWKRNNIFGRNRIYNFHLMWGSGLLDEAFGPLSESQSGRAAGMVTDLLFETGVGKTLGSYAWRNMKQDADSAFNRADGYDGGFIGLKSLLQGLDSAAKRPKLHLVGHSAGSIVLGALLSALDRFGMKNVDLASIHLMAPACTVSFFNKHYGPYLSDDGALPLTDKIYLYCLNEEQELRDKVSAGSFLSYDRSLLYLVSRAYEDVANMPIAGMKKFADGLKSSSKLKIDYSKSDATASTSYGGFDNDAVTMTTIIGRVLGREPEAPPRQSELIGY